MSKFTSSLSTGMTKQQAIWLAIKTLQGHARDWERGNVTLKGQRDEQERLLEAAEILRGMVVTQ